MAIETELKLTLAESDVDAFKTLLAKASPANGPLADMPAAKGGVAKQGAVKAAAAGPQRLLSIYFDTPTLALANRDMALRLRRVKRRWIQTLKQSEQAGGGLFQRVELEVPVAGKALDLELVDDDVLRDFLQQPEIASALAPLFTTDIQRARWIIRTPDGTTVEVALDQGTISAHPLSETICEVELELLEGDTAALFDLALQWSQTLALLPETLSKAARGFRLHQRFHQGATSAQPVAARQPRLRHAMSPSQGFALVVREALRHFQENIGGILQQGGIRENTLHKALDQHDTRAPAEAEYVHQARVALRRLRSALRAFAALDTPLHGDALSDDLRWLAATLGEVRDLDVLLENTLPPIIAAAEDDSELQRLRDQLRLQRAEYLARARAALHSPRCSTVLITLLKWGQLEAVAAGKNDADTTLTQFAQQALQTQRRKVVRLLRDWHTLDAKGRHDLRKKAKKLRYALEFFSPLYQARAVEKYLRQLKKLQRMLGDMNDAATTQTTMADLAARHPAIAYPAGIVAGWTRHQARHAEAQMEQHIEKLQSTLQRALPLRHN